MTTKETKRAMRDRPLHLVFQRVQDPPASAPASSAPTSERKSQKPAPDMTQATNEARKSAAILPEGFNPASDRKKSASSRTSKPNIQEEVAVQEDGDGWDDDDDDDDWQQPKPADKKTSSSKDNKATKEKKSEAKGDKKDVKTGKGEKSKPSEKAKEKEKDKSKEKEKMEKPKEKGKDAKDTKDKESKEKEKTKEEPPPLIAFASEMDTRLGFKVDWPPSPCYVTKVEGGSWAEMMQVKVDLRLDKAGGKDVAKMSKEKLKKLLDETRPLQLAFVKDKKKKKPPKPEQNDSVLGGMFG